MSYIHPKSDVDECSIGEGTNIWQFVVVMKGAIIGSDCNICANSLIEGNVKIGNRVTVKSGVSLWDGIIVENDVFIGPNATFTNDLFPRSKKHLESHPSTIIEQGASIGANSTIVCGNIIGKHAFIAAGSVVTKDVPDYCLVAGVPAKCMGWVSEHGSKLTFKENKAICKISGDEYYLSSNKVAKK